MEYGGHKRGTWADCVGRSGGGQGRSLADASEKLWNANLLQDRYFCPSCYQKRVLLYGEWVEENVLEPVAHRQYVFTVPRLRPIFGRRRA